jgi:hypothetical protein
MLDRNVDCANAQSCTSNAGLSKFKFTSGKTHRLRLINPSADAVQRFTIDDHVLTVIANDFVPVVPYNVTVVTLAPGQRSDVVVTAGSDPKTAVWMRSNISTLCSVPSQPYALAAVYYEDADTTSVPTSEAFPYVESTCANVRTPSPRQGGTPLILTIDIGPSGENCATYVHNTTSGPSFYPGHQYYCYPQ